MLSKLLIKNFTKVPLLLVSFNLEKYKKNEAKNSCLCSINLNFRNDEYIKETVNKLIDYIRENYDMEKIV